MLNPVFKVFGAVRDTLVSRMGACIFLMAMGGAGAVSGQQSAVYQSFVADPVRSILPDFSYAGYAYGEKPIPEPSVVLNVVEYGVLPDTGEDLTEVVQRLIDQAGERGGGVIYFPPGEYCFNTGDAKHYLQINHDHLVLRGAGTSTVFRLVRPLTQHEPAPWLTPALIQTGTRFQGTEMFWGVPSLRALEEAWPAGALGVGQDDRVYEAPKLTDVVAGARKGDRALQVADSSGIKAGDCILLSMRNTSDEGALIHEMLAPIESFHEKQLAARSAGKLRTASYQWLVEVAGVPDSKTLALRQPLRRDIQMRFAPEVYAAPMLHHIGIEHLKISSGWDGPYKHHGGAEMDYGWKAINMVRVSHGWIRDVVIENFTVPVTLKDSRNITVRHVVVEDPLKIGGHYGIKCYSHACDNLIEEIQFNSYRTHGTGVEGNSYGNVFRNVIVRHGGRKRAEFDCHGFCFAPPACNLFENITGQGAISGGGALFNLPHAAQYNTFWNCECDVPKGEVFESWAATTFDVPAYRLFPKSILVGVCTRTGTAVVEGSSADRNDEWLYVEDLNQTAVEPSSLYEAQLKLRLNKSKLAGN
ncbi:DUF4955 domain-containing protein [Pontiella sulfatireligans]|uniref:Pectate lyase superfamily protein domain-containing protein n=1 Tax=Pontiella sulfatireligans TaxID=2750658 RepID=A0A6C2UI40_9BACT|nr:DUF4955 domain-containing protein [Pontiella sulfatireligans]VGO18994.1 hypothetical protein SCARR_01048 [Pontiella sulfatireligans]